MPTRAENYLANAEECERMARAASGTARGQFLELAKQWRELARQAETSQPAPPPHSRES